MGKIFTGQWASSKSIIDDTQAFSNKTYSSEKIDQLTSNKAEKSNGSLDEILVNDGNGNPKSSWVEVWDLAPANHNHSSASVTLNSSNFWGVLDGTVNTLQELADFIDDNIWFWANILFWAIDPTTEWEAWDVYVNTTSWDIFKKSANWAIQWNIRWAQGIQGIQGVQWPQGIPWQNGAGTVASIVWGTKISIDNTDPSNPVIIFDWVNASEVSYNNVDSGLSSSDVKWALDENASAIAANTQAIANLATAQGSFSSSTDPVFAITTSEQNIPFTVTSQSSNTDIYEFDDINNEVDVKLNAPYNFSTNMNFLHNTNQERTLTIRGRKVSDNSLIYERQITIEAGNWEHTHLNTSTLLTIGQGSYPSAPFSMYFTVEADGVDITLENFSSILSTGTQYDVDITPDWGDIGWTLSSQTDLQAALDGKSDNGHNHDDRYYTETEIDSQMSGKSDTGHTHDDRYYTEAEIDSQMSGKEDAKWPDDNYVTDAEKVVLGNTSWTNTWDQDLSSLAEKSNVLEKDNTDAFTPDADYEPATKKYVDDEIANAPWAETTQSTLIAWEDLTAGDALRNGVFITWDSIVQDESNSWVVGIWKDNGSYALGQSFYVSEATDLISVKPHIKRQWSPTFDVICRVYDATNDNLIATSDNIINAATFWTSTIGSEGIFNFSSWSFAVWTYYFKVEPNTVHTNVSNYLQWVIRTVNAYTQWVMYRFTNTSVIQIPNSNWDFKFTIDFWTSNDINKVYKTTASDVNKILFIWTAWETVLSGESVKVNSDGVDPNQSGLTPWKFCYLSDVNWGIGNEAWTNSALVGIAISPTHMNIWATTVELPTVVSWTSNIDNFATAAQPCNVPSSGADTLFETWTPSEWAGTYKITFQGRSKYGWGFKIKVWGVTLQATVMPSNKSYVTYTYDITTDGSDIEFYGYRPIANVDYQWYQIMKAEWDVWSKEVTY